MSAARQSERGALAIVLHTHMPYVYGYGGSIKAEEWLWEVYATSYLPVTDLIAGGAPLTLSLTPVVGDQLEAAGAAERYEHFLDVVRRESHAQDRAGLILKEELTGEVRASDHSWSTYDHALMRLQAGDRDLLAPLAGTASWTSAATHAVLPLVATEAGVRLQVGSGVASHRRRTGRWDGGLWLPECAWDAELEGPLVEQGVHSVCVELTPATPAGDDPWRTPGGLRIVPIDRPLIDAVWHHTGYPAQGAYRDSYRRSFQDHGLWNNAGDPYDPELAAAQARADAQDWVGQCAARLAGGGDRVVAFDTELFGHWWDEGPLFLAAVVEQCAVQGVELLGLDALLARAELGTRPAPPAGSWGRERDLRTWSGPSVATIAWELRRAELDLLAERTPGSASDAKLRDLLALQSSDWAFMVAEGRVAQYAWSRFADHRQALNERSGSLPSSSPRLRHLAPDLARDALAVG